MSARSAGPLRSALYEGTVTHRRADPSRRFSNEVALPLLFLDELPALRAVHPLVDLDPTPHRRLWPAAMRFRRDDFLPSDSASLLDSVTDAVAGAGGSVRGPVAMLGHLRTWGWLFNPLTLYYCFDPSGRDVEWTVLEVSNTPWHERCRYVVGPPGAHTFAKAMHVSPFLPDDATYTLRYSAPGDGVHVGLDLEAPAAATAYRQSNEQDPQRADPQLAASMVLRRRPLDRAGLARLLWRYPLMTARVSGGIYAQALRLTGARVPIHPHPGRGSTCPALPSAEATSPEPVHA
ncbi:MAG: DUF1365 domain-containing protein [Acidimicrobiales bacterium]